MRQSTGLQHLQASVPLERIRGEGRAALPIQTIRGKTLTAAHVGGKRYLLGWPLFRTGEFVASEVGNPAGDHGLEPEMVERGRVGYVAVRRTDNDIKAKGHLAEPRQAER
jgi:hypothetical protein